MILCVLHYLFFFEEYPDDDRIHFHDDLPNERLFGMKMIWTICVNILLFFRFFISSSFTIKNLFFIDSLLFTEKFFNEISSFRWNIGQFHSSRKKKIVSQNETYRWWNYKYSNSFIYPFFIFHSIIWGEKKNLRLII